MRRRTRVAWRAIYPPNMRLSTNCRLDSSADLQDECSPPWTQQQMSQTKKRHHYVPVTYLRAFCDCAGRLRAYRKDAPKEPLYVAPSGIAYERYYYSQPIEGGGRDNSIEDFFSRYESKWPALIERLKARSLVEKDRDLLETFMGMMRTRVPAARDMAELSLAENLKSITRALDRAGRLPSKPPGMADFADRMQIGIDPYQSILAMPALLQGFGTLLGLVGLHIVYNETAISFLTSDNPVVTLDPDIPEAQMRPYEINRVRQRVELLFPVSPMMLVRGHSDLRDTRSISYTRLQNAAEVRRINRMVARFGYRFVFASTSEHSVLIEKYADKSPALVHRNVRHDGGEIVHHRFEFTTRPKKPKWNSDKKEPSSTAA